MFIAFILIFHIAAVFVQKLRCFSSVTVPSVYELCHSGTFSQSLFRAVACKAWSRLATRSFLRKDIRSEKGVFDMKDVCDHLCEKLIFRRAMCWGDVKANTAGQVSEN